MDGAFVADPPAERWRPFASTLWSVVPTWRDRAAAELEIYREAIDLVLAPCALGLLLEDAVPLAGQGWRDPHITSFLGFLELADDAYDLLPPRPGEQSPDDDDADKSPDHAEMECFLGATMSGALADDPDETVTLLPYLGPKTVHGLRQYIELPSHRVRWRGIDIDLYEPGSRFVPLDIDAGELLPDPRE
jgi:hypothetical protein